MDFQLETMYYYVEQFRRKDSVVAVAAEEVLTTKMLRCSAAGSDGINQPNQSTTVIDGAVKEESESSRLKGQVSCHSITSVLYRQVGNHVIGHELMMVPFSRTGVSIDGFVHACYEVREVDV